MRPLICGSLAYDTIMVFQDHFRNHILPDKVHILNVSFLVPKLRREFGGTAGNIAYNLNLLGGDALPMAAVGQDFDSYAAWLDQKGITREFLFDVGRDVGVDVREQVLRDEDLFGADEAFLTSTTREALPIVTVNDRTIGNGKPGPITWKLLNGFRKVAEAS